ncbi:hypothetical protein HanHA300_Chr14g0518041 [Helianthus annuus]|nr:hypothetical protein HanHA300_Chr14g0518041 [Helianthus annuus]KAJ0467825.1 hypothetical protein HanIR_Chr14g0689581 [Helianthus annuus]
MLMQAFSMYSDKKKGSAFKFIYCWDVARHFSKSARVPLAGKLSSKRTKTSSSTNCSDARTEFEKNLSDNEVKRNAHLVEINKKDGTKSHTSVGEYTEGLANQNEQICMFNSIQEQINAQKKGSRAV